ncbi:hypothetical protein Tco_0492063 [Tanacetum coccineum]
MRAQSQAKDTVIVKLKEQIKSLKGNVDDSKVKMDMDEIETLNIELEHRVTKLVAENEHLKQTYKQLYDSIKPKRVQSKEQCDALIKQVNIKSGEISDLNAKLQEQGLVIAALKNELRKLKGKALDKEAIETHSVDPKVSKDNMEPITPKLLNKRTAHSSYIKHTQEEALVLKDIVEHVKANYPQDSLLESAFRYTKVIQDLLSHISRTCPSINNLDPQLVAVTPRKKDKKVRFAESLTSTENTKTDSSPSKHKFLTTVLHSTGVRLSTSASGSQPSGNTRNDRILQTPSSNSKNKVEAHPRNVKSSLNKRNGTVKVNGSAVVQNLKKQDNLIKSCCPNRPLEIGFRLLEARYRRIALSLTNFHQYILWAELVFFIGNAPTKEEHSGFTTDGTKTIIETIHVDFDELTAMASEHSSSGPALYEMTPVSISSGLVPNPPSSTPLVPPSRSDWDLFGFIQPMIDESLNP